MISEKKNCTSICRCGELGHGRLSFNLKLEWYGGAEHEAVMTTLEEPTQDEEEDDKVSH